VLPKQNSIFTFGVPLYSALPSASASTDAPAPQTSGAEATAGTVVPKTVLDAPHLLFTLYGNQFCFRAAERAGRKFKSKASVEL
jgi:ribonuclease P protein subunit POP4